MKWSGRFSNRDRPSLLRCYRLQFTITSFTVGLITFRILLGDNRYAKKEFQGISKGLLDLIHAFSKFEAFQLILNHFICSLLNLAESP